MDNFQIKGTEFLDDKQKQEVQRIIEKYHEKIKYSIKNNFYLKIVLKDYSKDKENKTKRKRFGVDIEISGEVPRINASSVEWDLNATFNSAFNKLLEEIEHKFHVSDKYK